MTMEKSWEIYMLLKISAFKLLIEMSGCSIYAHSVENRPTQFLMDTAIASNVLNTGN